MFDRFQWNIRWIVEDLPERLRQLIIGERFRQDRKLAVLLVSRKIRPVRIARHQRDTKILALPPDFAREHQPVHLPGHDDITQDRLEFRQIKGKSARIVGAFGPQNGIAEVLQLVRDRVGNVGVVFNEMLIFSVSMLLCIFLSLTVSRVSGRGHPAEGQVERQAGYS